MSVNKIMNTGQSYIMIETDGDCATVYMTL